MNARKTLAVGIVCLVVVVFSVFLIKNSFVFASSSDREEAISCVKKLYEAAIDEGMELGSRCLGRCGDYSVDVVSVPRSEEDDKLENQCEDFRKGITKSFIELDKMGNIVRIMDLNMHGF